jgi:hypothetical protein
MHAGRVAALMTGRALACPAVALRTAVNGTLRSRRLAHDDRARFDDEHPALNQSPGHRRSCAREDTGIGLARDPHPLGRRSLVEALEIGETHRLEFVHANRNRACFARGAPDRPKATTKHLAADVTRDDGPGHTITSICSQSRCVNCPTRVRCEGQRIRLSRYLRKCPRRERRISRCGDTPDRRNSATARGLRKPGCVSSEVVGVARIQGSAWLDRGPGAPHREYLHPHATGENEVRRRGGTAVRPARGPAGLLGLRRTGHCGIVRARRRGAGSAEPCTDTHALPDVQGADARSAPPT